MCPSKTSAWGSQPPISPMEQEPQRPENSCCQSNGKSQAGFLSEQILQEKGECIKEFVTKCSLKKKNRTQTWNLPIWPAWSQTKHTVNRHIHEAFSFKPLTLVLMDVASNTNRRIKSRQAGGGFSKSEQHLELRQKVCLESRLKTILGEI